MVDAKADVNALSGGYLIKATSGVQFTVEFVAGQTALHLACEVGEYGFEMAQILVASKIDVGIADVKGMTALDFAKQAKGADKVVAMLLEASQTSSDSA